MNRKLDDTIRNAIVPGPAGKDDAPPQEDIDLTDDDLDDVAGGCGAMCGTMAPDQAGN